MKGDKTSAMQVTSILSRNFPTIELTFSMCNLVKESALVLCIGNNFSYEEAINFLQDNAPLQNVFWFYDGSESIIGSGDKEKLGKVYI